MPVSRNLSKTDLDVVAVVANSNDENIKIAFPQDFC